MDNLPEAVEQHIEEAIEELLELDNSKIAVVAHNHTMLYQRLLAR